MPHKYFYMLDAFRCLVGPANTFFSNCPVKLYCCQPGEFSNLFTGKTTYVIRTIFDVFVQL